MSIEDIPRTLELEKHCFGEGWTPTPFEKELLRTDCSYFIIKDGDKVVGYSGTWLILEELHLTIMAVHMGYRRKKLGQKLLLNLLRDGVVNGAKWCTLEVKANNFPAQRMYEKFGFVAKGLRKQYYHQDRQDAIIMWTEELDTPEYQDLLNKIESELIKV